MIGWNMVNYFDEMRIALLSLLCCRNVPREPPRGMFSHAMRVTPQTAPGRRLRPASRSSHRPRRPFPLTCRAPERQTMSPSAPRDALVDAIPLARLAPSPTRQPAPSALPPPPEKPNLWSILRDAVGKDLTRMPIPVFFNEPISFLQRLAEDVEYTHLLDAAADPALAGTPDRPALVAAFMISHYSSTASRASKPFNPLLGETFDLVDHHRGIALLAEQVAHHPPTSAIFVQGRGWRYHTAHEIKNRFLGNTLEVWPEGPVHVEFQDGEHYVYDQIRTSVHNIILGELWLDNSGTTTIREITKGLFITSLKFKRNSFLFREAKTLGDLTGKVMATSSHGKPGKTLRKLSGNWNSELNVDGNIVWKATTRPPKSHTGGHNMPAWAWRLNPEVDAEEKEHASIAKTDSRLRPDQRALEKGLHKLAASEKERLESAQRKRRKEAEEKKADQNPLWFEHHHDPTTGRKEWRYRHNYFAAKEKATGPWPQLAPNIF